MRAIPPIRNPSRRPELVVLGSLLSACSSNAGVSVGGPHAIVGPIVFQPSADCPLSRAVQVGFTSEVSLAGAATDGHREIAIDQPLASLHEVPLVGLYADNTWTVQLTATDADGRSLVLDPIVFTTPPLPDAFPIVDVTTEEIASMQPGYTLMPVTSPPFVAWLVAFDADGEVAWYYDGRGARFRESVLLPNGHLATLHYNELLEIDWLGRVYRRLGARASHNGGLPIAAWSLDHELSVDGDGNWITLTQSSRGIETFPISYANRTLRAPVRIAADEVIVIDPDSGAILDRRAWPDFASLDRIGYDSLNVLDPGLDWSHANSAVEFPSGDSWLLSARHQDAVVRLDKETGQIRWILGTHDNWGSEFAPLLLDPVGDGFAWPYHQHAAKISADERHVLVFDNGNHRASPWTIQIDLAPADTNTRVVQYEVDEAAHTARQDWQFVLDPPVFSQSMGDADWLPNGHVLATYAYVMWDDHVENADLGVGKTSVRVVEFDPSTGHVVWDLAAWAPVDDAHANWQTYRAERFTGFDVSTPSP
jgi:arylsulfate sulfotransferase